MIPVPGTRIAVRLPDGFAPARGFLGFEDPSREASLGVSEIGVPLEQLAASWEGMPSSERSRCTVGGMPALWIASVEHAPTGAVARWLLAIDLGGQTIAAVATAPVEGDPALKEALRDAVRTAELLPEVAPGAELPFRFEEGARLKVAARMGDMVLLTEGGRALLEAEAPMLTLSASEGPPDIDSVDLLELSTRYLQAIPGLVDLEPTEGEPYELSGGGRAIWIRGQAAFQGITASMTLCQQLSLLPGAPSSLIVAAVGRCGGDRPDFVSEVRKVVGSLTRA